MRHEAMSPAGQARGPTAFSQSAMCRANRRRRASRILVPGTARAASRFRDFRDRLQRAAKAPTATIIATLRKLLVTLNANVYRTPEIRRSTAWLATVADKPGRFTSSFIFLRGNSNARSLMPSGYGSGHCDSLKLIKSHHAVTRRAG